MIRRALVLAVLFASVASHAHAQDVKPPVIDLGDIEIKSDGQGPNAFYFLSRTNLGYEVMDLRTSFLDEIVRSVQRDPF